MPSKTVMIGFAAALWTLTATAAYFMGLERGRTEPIPTHFAMPAPPADTRPISSARVSTSPDWSAGFPSEGGADLPAAGFRASASAPTARSSSSPMNDLMAAAALSDRARRDAALEDAVARLSAEQIPGALEALMAQEPSPERNRALAAVVRHWGGAEPQKALAYATDEPAPALREMLQREAIQGWAAVNPLEALAYARENPDGTLPRGSTQAVFRGVADMPTALAMDFLTQIETRPNARYIDDVMRALYERSPTEMVAWTESLPEGQLRSMAILETVDEWSQYNPSAALAWMEQHAQDEVLQRARRDLAGNWARLDPEAAVAWFGALPESDRSPQIMEEIFDSWLRYEPETAAAWLGQQPPSPAMDEAIREYIDYIDRVDPATAMAWAATLTEPRLQSREAMRVSRTWARADPQAALQYLESSPLAFRGREQVIAEAQRRLEREEE